MSEDPTPVPVPTTVSEAAQAALSVPRGPRTQWPPLGDTEGWLEAIGRIDAQMLERFGSFEWPIETEAIELGGVPTFHFTPNGVTADGFAYLYFHGGGLVLGGGDGCRMMSAGASLGSGLETWAPDYRMPPHHPYPTPLDDCIVAYRALLELRPADRIVVGGGSAGGNLAAATVLRAKDEGLPLPAAVVLNTPEVDLTESGDSFVTNLEFDNVLSPLIEVNRLYADGHDLAHPYLSPLFGDLTGFPPTFLQTGTRDLFLSNTVRMHRALRTAGVDAELHVWEAMPHGGFGGAPEDAEMVVELRRFFARLGIR